MGTAVDRPCNVLFRQGCQTVPGGHCWDRPRSSRCLPVALMASEFQSARSSQTAPRCAQLPGASSGVYTWTMSTLADVDAIVSQFPPSELAELEQFVRQARIEKTRGEGRSVLDMPPLDLGCMLQPLGDRERWYDEMLEERM